MREQSRHVSRPSRHLRPCTREGGKCGNQCEAIGRPGPTIITYWFSVWGRRIFGSRRRFFHESLKLCIQLRRRLWFLSLSTAAPSLSAPTSSPTPSSSGCFLSIAAVSAAIIDTAPTLCCSWPFGRPCWRLRAIAAKMPQSMI